MFTAQRIWVVLMAGLMTALVVGCGGGDSTDTNHRLPPESESADAASPSPGTPMEPSSESVSKADSEPAVVPRARVDLPTPVPLTDGDWPQFRGRYRDGVARADGLLREWPSSGPRELWQVAVGEGYAAPAVVGENVFLNDYDEAQSQWMVRCLSLDDGEEKWRYTVAKRIRPNHAITRSSPATDGGFVFSIDPKCELHCLDARDGSLIWKKLLPKLYGTLIPPWYNGQCPLIEGDRLILATGGSSLLVALDKATGETIWETPNERKSALSHSSVMPVEIEGVKQYVYMTLTGLIGVDAKDGRWLWEFPWKFNVAVPTSPVQIGANQFFLTSCYQAETAVCEVTREGEEWLADLVYQLTPNDWNSEVHTPIMLDGKLYGVGKRRRGLWTCLDPTTGDEIWTSDKQADFGLGGYLLAEGMFFVLDGNQGTLRLLDATADEYRELAEAHVLEGPDVWALPVLAHGRLLIRDLKKLVCLQVGQEPVTTAMKPAESTDEGLRGGR